MINLVNIDTNEIERKVRPGDDFEEDEDVFGQVTCLKVHNNLLAAGYSTGHVLVFDLTGNMEVIHKFHLHRSPITCVTFDQDGTEMYSGSEDTYVVVYDLVADTANYKLMGHKDHVT